MKNLDKLSVVELNKSELQNTQGGFWKELAFVGWWVWDNWDELETAARPKVSNTYYPA